MPNIIKYSKRIKIFNKSNVYLVENLQRMLHSFVNNHI